MGSKILITGVAGFIGFHLAEALLEKGYKVVGIDNINEYYDVNLKYDRLAESGIEKEDIGWYKAAQSAKHTHYSFFRMNLEDKAPLFDLCKKESFDMIINLAAQAGVRYSIENPDVYIQSNVVGFLNILEACRQFNIKNLIYASSSSVYGLNSKMPFSVEDRVDNPVSLYAATKRSNELMAHAYSHLYNIKTIGLRFFTVYGPWGRPDMAPFLFANAIKNGEAIKVFNHGKLQRDFTYIDDIVNGIISVVDKTILQPIEGENYKLLNIGNNTSVELLSFISEIENSMQIKAVMDMLDMQPGDVLATWSDIDDLINEYNYQPKTSISEGVSKFIKWYASYYS